MAEDSDCILETDGLIKAFKGCVAVIDLTS